ncbi:hypothetical protein SAMN00017405_0473 [Desulfonispora thiosulfatigenes DSM 11270]|uniref:Lipoprotein n=1 Tax=Desulfonispora thiosulfatigenes DSM 11270 TaxID=656914 RepID=A0A1W1VR46_DESTI|nr:hypothetical protein [Desulfonispora thiosulfatigenes]SMB95743.1 hypothetical protein SAMN00017405_0473 [Desulfonispora thiosulfatigenes DSM 11270]
MRKKILLLILVMITNFSLGCDDSKIIKRDVVPKIVNNIVSDTNVAIKEKDVKKAREIWSKVSEYGVKANQHGDEKLSETLTFLASTYVKLIKYCETDDENILKGFKKDFSKGLLKLKELEPGIKLKTGSDACFCIVN